MRGVLGGVGAPGSRGKGTRAPRGRRVTVEALEDRRLLSVGGSFDFGDLPDNYGTTLAADGARHEAVGPTLGALRDAEADGLPTVDATGDDTNGSADEDGVARGAEYRICARGFGNVSAVADQGGNGDVAKLYDSGEDGVDVWAAAYLDGQTWSTMSSPSRLLYEVLAFEHVGGYGFNAGLGEDHGTNRKDHAEDVDFVFQYGVWEGDEEPEPATTNPSTSYPWTRQQHAGR